MGAVQVGEIGEQGMGPQPEDIARALAVLPASTWIMSSLYETTRTGILVRRVMQCADDPVCLCVSLRKGSRIDPVVRDSHVFAVSLMNCTDKLLIKKFDLAESTEEDPFDSFRVVRLKTGAPVMAKALVAFDCEVLSHVDLEADHQLYIGRVVDACGFDGSLGSACAADDQGPM